MLALLFMRIFTGIILACFVSGVIYAVGHRSGGRGPIADKAKALIFGIIALVFIVLIIAHAILLFIKVYPDLSFIFSTSFDMPIQIIGLILICSSMVPAVWGCLSLGKLTADIRLAEEHRVVKTGVYRWIRHPMYAALIFWCAGSLLFFKSLLFLILFALIPAAYVEARRQEKLLIEAFGEEYERYRDVVGMFFPKFPKRDSNT